MPTFQLARKKMYGSVSVAFGTVINRLVEPIPGLITNISDLWYTCAGTAHTLTLMRPLGLAFASSAAAAAQTTLNIDRDPGVYSAYGVVDVADNAIAANDFVVYQTADGTYTFDKVASVSGLALTMTANIPTSTVLKGAPVWFFGAIADVNPADGLAHATLNPPASVTTKYGADLAGAISGLFASIVPSPQMRALKSATLGPWPLNGKGEPIVIQSNNITATGTIEMTQAIYSLLG